MDHEADSPRSGYEFVIKDPEELIQFYRDVFRYEVLTQSSDTGQWLIHIRKPDFSGEMIEDVRPITKAQGADTSYLGSFYVKSVEETLERVKTYGGRLFVGDDSAQPISETEWGRQAYCCDPERNMFGIVEHIDKYS